MSEVQAHSNKAMMSSHGSRSEPVAPRLLKKQHGKSVAIWLLIGKEKRDNWRSMSKQKR